MEENKGMLCNGYGCVEEWDDSLNDWIDVRCEDCGGTGIEEDEEGR